MSTSAETVIPLGKPRFRPRSEGSGKTTRRSLRDGPREKNKPRPTALSAAKEELMKDPEFASSVSKYVRDDLSALYQRPTGEKVYRRQRIHEERLEQYRQDSAMASAAAEILLPEQPGTIVMDEESGMSTADLTQRDIKKELDVQSARKCFEVKLSGGGRRSLDFARGGRYLLVAGGPERKGGKLAVVEWQKGKVVAEWGAPDSVSDACFLSDERLVACATPDSWLRIYETAGKTYRELHCLRSHRTPSKLEYLPYHWLLCCASQCARIQYLDVSTGQPVSNVITGMGPPTAMCLNKWNAVTCLGHSKGVVTMWSPSCGDKAPLVRMLCNRGPVRDVVADHTGRVLATCGADGTVRLWDLRTFKSLTSLRCSSLGLPTVLDISQRGLLAVGGGATVEVWPESTLHGTSGEGEEAVPLAAGAKAPLYLRHRLPGGCVLSDMAFCPFEDYLAVGHSGGFGTVVVPGSGEPNYDTFEANPFTTRKQRRESEVKLLLEKIPSSLITLVPGTVGQVQEPGDDQSQATASRPKVVNNKKKSKNRNAEANEDGYQKPERTEVEEEERLEENKKRRKAKKKAKVLIFEETTEDRRKAIQERRAGKKEMVEGKLESALDLFSKRVKY